MLSFFKYDYQFKNSNNKRLKKRKSLFFKKTWKNLQKKKTKETLKKKKTRFPCRKKKLSLLNKIKKQCQ